jgi:asparagine synthase (glutamine-hydrolysing)
MCSIIGFSKRSIPKAAAVAGFETTKSRGPDMSRFVETKSGWLGFHRLSIMGLTPEGMQPFEQNGDMVVCNGELYGFRPIKAELVGLGYRFKSGSD